MEKKLKIFLGIFIFLLFVELPGSSLFDPDEARYAEIPREMLASGDYVTPTLNGAHYFEKPPLLYWLNAGMMKVFGENAYAARLTTRLSALGTVLLLVTLSGGGIVTGLWAGLIYLTAPLPFALGRINLTDGLLSFFLTLAFLCLKKILLEKNSRSSQRWLEIGLGAGLGLAMLTKGLIGIVLPGGVFFLWILILQDWKSVPKLIFSWTLPVFLIISLPWFILVERAHPGFSKYFFIHEHFQRFATDQAKRTEPFYYFAAVFVAGFLPWVGSLSVALFSLFRRLRREASLLAEEIYLTLWMGVIFLFFSASHSKLIPYILPMFPPAAILAAYQIKKSKIKNKWRWAAVSMGAAVWAGLIVAVPAIALRYSDRSLAETAQTSGADHVVCYKTYSQNFPWIFKKPIPVVDFQGELASDDVKSPDTFWSSDEFWRTWYSGEKVAAVMRKSEWEGFLNLTSIEAIPVAENRRNVVVLNFNPGLNK